MLQVPRWFRVKKKRVLGGEHPCPGGDRAVHRIRLQALVSFGVTTFVDLTESSENGIEPYKHSVRNLAHDGLRVSYHRFPLRDAQAPGSERQVEEILDVIDIALLNEEVVYVHCRSGIGRTGTILALHLVRHGDSPARALKLLQAAWRRDPRSRVWPRCPQTEQQVRYVLDARAGSRPQAQ